MANTDTSANADKPTGASSGAGAAKNSAGETSTAARVEAQAGDPYRPDGGNDYSLAIEPEDTGEATIANLYQAVPLEHEGAGAAQPDGAGGDGDGAGDGGAKAGGVGNGRGDGQGDTLLPDGATEVVETADGAPNDDGGLGDGDVPDARGLDATLPQFDLGGDGIGAAGSQIGDGTSGGVVSDDDGGDGGDGGENTDIGPVADSDETGNEISEFATGGDYTGVTAFADDPDVTDIVSYEITGGDDRFEIDPDTGEITVKDGSSFDAETERSVDVEVTATSTDGSTSTGTFTITIGDENEFPIGPVTDSDTTGNEVSEFATGGEYSGVTAFADDPDVTDVVSYEITGGDDRFDIDPDTGEITVKAGSTFDAETEQSVDVEVTATSTDGSTSVGTFTITIGDENEFPIGPVTDSDTAGNEVSEFATGGEYSGVTAFADDPDVTDVVSYEITGGDDRFDIDPDTGEITVKAGSSFDAETEQSVDVKVTATSTDGSTSVGTFTITIGDENEFPIGPVTDSDTTGNEVSEFATGGEYSGVTAFADDPDVTDVVSYEITGGDDRFEIDPDTGEITVKAGSSFDAETEQSVDVEVTATSTDGSTSVGTFTITIGDENEFPIGPVTDSDTTGNEVSEFATGGEYSGVTAFADDPDVTDVVSYEITGGDDRFDIDPDTGEITVKQGSSFDAETEQSVDVEVTATSTDGSTSVGTFTITIGDENEFPIGPVTDSDTIGNEVSEFATGGEYSGVTAFADDPDVTDVVSYEITGGDDRFEIDPDTGVITVKAGSSFDHETEPSVDVEVTATSTDGSTSTGTFTVDITDGNEPPDLVVCLENGSVQFVVNGSFEQFEGTLSGTDPKGYYENPTSIEGWSYQDVDVQQSARWGTGASDGDHRLDLSANQNGTASQQIDGMLEGQVYTFSFDSAPRGPVGETVAEVYWNGELIDTIDPAEAGAGWNTYTYNIVGGSGDGSDTLTFVEVGGKNASFGTFIDNVSIVSDNRIAVVEEFYGAEIAPLQVFDPDVGDTHTFTVSDDRFEVVVADGKYVLKLKDDQAFDYETETQVTVDVTVTDSGGLSDTETVVIDVLDVDENLGPIGPVTDSDNALNNVAENGSGGEYVGVTAFAEDPDVGDTVTYSITDDRFDIDPDTGVITVKDGVSFDHETMPTVDLEVTATSSDGSSSTGTFTVNITDVNEAPDLDFDPELGPGTSVTLTFVEEYAGYSNSLGVFYMDGNGNPVGGEIVWVNQNELSPGDTATVYLEGVEADEIGYFLIPDGADFNTLASGDEVTFQKDGDGNWQAVLNGTPLVGKDANVFFSGDGSLNPNGYDYTVESGITIGFEDLAGGGDEDFDDLVFDQTTQETNAQAAVYEEEFGAEVGGLTVFDPDVGDSHTFTVSDDRFEVVTQNGEYVLKLKDDQKLDYETETQVTVDVTATDSGGLSDTETIVIDVIDIIENTAPVGPVRDVDGDSNFVQENSAGGTVVGVTAFASDPDASDSVTYSITDGRFEIDPETGVITVADNAVIDREATPFIDIEVTATSTDGSTATGTFRVTIGDEDEYDIGPVSDVDPTDNAISESADGGESAGITAFADDPDATDTVTYELSGDDRFEIDENTGVITVVDGSSFDAETEPSIDLTVTATSTDGSSSSKTFTVDVVDGNEAPDLIVHLENGSQQFVVNGSFEVFDGPLGGKDGSGWYQNPNSIEGWSYTDVDVHQAGHNNFGATDGDHHLDLAAKTNGWASQEIEGQLDGQVYHLTFDMKSRGVVGQSVAEVYWNGELIDTIDPATTGSGWQTYAYDIVGGSGDGSNTLTFVEIGSDNNGGALIDSVSIVSDNRTAVVEEFFGADIAPLSVIDPDVGDTHTFTVSDDRFEVVVDGDKYLLKLKDDQAFDYETETQVTVEVTATDSGGLSDTEIVVIDVIDIDDTNTPIGQLIDSDTAVNSVAENGAGGEYVGITAFANDPDSGDSVTYSITDTRFEIDPDTGVLTVKDGVSFDHEATPTVDVEVTATSTDGSSTTGTFTVNITDVNEAPDLDFDPELGPGTAVTLTFVEEYAGYSNSLGVFYMDGNGNPVGGEIVWVNQNELSPGDTANVYLEGVEAGEIGYFLIPDGADYNTLASGDEVTFQKDGNGNWQAVMDGTPLIGKDANVFFSGDGSLNPDGYDYTAESGITIGFEDIAGGGDEDFDDLVFDQTNQETNATAAVYEEELGAEVGTLSVFDPDVGDTHTFTVSDDRFEVVAQNGDYVLKLKDDQALDYETETQVTVEVTATDSGGLSDTETIVIDVIDVEPEGPVDTNAPVGPVRDTDTSQNLVAATAAAGMVVGLTAFAQDVDAGDTVTYAIDDDRFDIDADTGVVTVANGATLVAGQTVNVTVTATSSDGSESSAVFPIEVTSGGDDNSPPDLIVGGAIYEPPKSAGHLDDHHDDHHGHHHDGDKGRHDHDDDDDDKPHGHTDDEDGFYVPENEAGVELVELSVVDPDVGDTHTFTVSDERFEVVSDGESYLLKLKDDMAVDFETEQSITLDVTATDSGGLSDTETITLDVLDGKDSKVKEYGTREDDILVGGDGNDRLKGRDGDDTLLGQAGNDKIYGGDGDDFIRGGTGNDVMKGGDGSDLFAYMLGDGNDTIAGGAGGNWIDIVDLANAADGTALGEYGTDWSITMTEGSIEQVDALGGDITLSQDAGGYIELADGGRVDFTDLEGIQY